MTRTHRPIASILMATGLAAALALPSAAQNSPAVPDLNPDDCSNGTFVSEPSVNPGLVADCRALVTVRNHWTRHPDNADLPINRGLRAWGYGNTVYITSWDGVLVEIRHLYPRVYRLRLSLDNNNINGTIPPELSQLTNLEILDLFGNQLTGPIPPEISRLTNLEILDLYGNQLTGRIPPEISRLTNLEILDLYGNQLTGRIPPEITKLTNLEWLYLHGNQLTGRIPPEITRLTNLKELFLGDNQLTGPIPPKLSRLTNLNELHLWYNQLTGPIPPEISRLTNLKGLFLRGNQLTGPIPPKLSRLTNLEELFLGDNQLTGPIPPEISRLTNLNELHLWYNQLTGPIPPEISRLTNLRNLNLSGNQLTGRIPPELSRLTNLEELFLDGNQLTGPIPAELSQLTNLELLRLGCNQLTGSIPAELSRKLWPVFCDDDGNVHEWAIEQIARWGITLGCGNGRFCPGDSITRSQMAAFLHRAVTHRSGQEPAPASEVTLNDVDEDAWYQRYAEWAVGTGVMRAPDGRFDPGGEVTRADMAEMLAAAFDHITPPAQAQGIFTDMANQPDHVVRAAEALRTAEVTEGCSTNPLRYCPGQPVTRAQMASFFHRALS